MKLQLEMFEKIQIMIKKKKASFKQQIDNFNNNSNTTC